ncbi:MAG: trypsin-like serine protease [Dysgonamonadaceae bacterium]|jgi:hypothetical protein|nr:trypsin-like serine protease [Dysgonamonadaceae bacterium]
MKKFYLLPLLLCFCGIGTIFAQISYGGVPLFLENTSLRNANALDFIEMPAFNVDSVAKANLTEEDGMRGAFQFAHKFYTHIEKGKQGTMQTLADGTKVWRAGIRSNGARSINLLFTKYNLPEGAKLFIYNTDHSHVIGAFDSRNNSEKQILPVRPVAGDAIIVEYSEPAGAAFEGELVIGEVNHAYRDLSFGGELRSGPSIPDVVDYPGDPYNDVPANYLCMPDVLCDESDAGEAIVRSTVLLIINGTSLCTGSLINNTENDEKPYLLTAIHCFTTTFPASNDFYTERAGTVIAFFNYQRPICGNDLKPATEMSVSGAVPRAIIEKKDIALLELKQTVPPYYNAYYAGWNAETTANNPPYRNIHHPYGAPKRYGLYNSSLQAATATYGIFDSNSHWRVTAWNVGSTHVGSSGSPIFDKDNLLVGTLSGGNSTCTGATGSDYFARFAVGWAVDDSPLQTYLDPNRLGVLKQTGYDPHTSNPIQRLSNADYNNGDQLVTTQFGSPNSGFVFGNNNLATTKFAEAFTVDQPSEVFGVYLTIPQMPLAYTSGVEVEIYSGDSEPATLLAHKAFVPRYAEYSRTNGTFGQTPDQETNAAPCESFVAFDTWVPVQSKFFIAYKINPETSSQFCVYNTAFASSSKANTAWIKDGSQWVEASAYAPHPVKTSLALQPVLRLGTGNAVPALMPEGQTKTIYYNSLSQQLTFDLPSIGSGEVFVYSVSGQLIDRLTFQSGDQHVRLAAQAKGSIGIVQVRYAQGVISGKIIY